MGRIGIICAVEMELLPFRRALSNCSIYNETSLTFYLGTIGLIEIVVLACGVGKVNAEIATRLLIERFEPKCIIVSGAAGALKPQLHIGDSVIASQVLYLASSYLTENQAVFFENYMPVDKKLLGFCRNVVDNRELKHDVYFGKVITSDVYVNTNRKQLFRKTNALCVDMETASIAHVCGGYQIPFVVVRSISDTDIDTDNQFGNFIVAAKNSYIIVKQLIELINRENDN